MPQSNVQRLIGDFAGLQIQASEELRSATHDDITTDKRLHHLQKAAHYSEQAFLVADNNLLQRALAYEQYKAACGAIMMVRNGYNSQRIQPDQ